MQKNNITTLSYSFVRISPHTFIMKLRYLIFLFSLFFARGVNAQNYIYYSSNTTFTSGTYYISGWGNVTLTIPAGETVIFEFSYAPMYGGGNLTVNGNLTTTQGMQIAGSTTVATNANLTVNGEFISAATTLQQGSATKATSLSTGGALIVAGQLSVTGNVVINGGAFSLTQTGKMSAGSIDLNGNNTISGPFSVSGTTNIFGGNNTLACPATFTSGNLINQSSNVFSGTGYINVTGNFTSDNPLTNSSTIVLNASGTGPGVSGKNSGSATLGTASPCTTLPVVFEDITAIIYNDTLKVNWTTGSETNNSHFDILISKDGNKFTKAGAVFTKAKNSNATTALQYEYIYVLQRGVSQFAASIFVIMLAGCGLLKRKKIVYTGFVAMPVLAFIIISSCSKPGNDPLKTTGENIFIKIIQVDVDGTETASKTIKAVTKY